MPSPLGGTLRVSSGKAEGGPAGGITSAKEAGSGGLSLHGRAQANFLRFINESLAPVAQAI